MVRHVVGFIFFGKNQKLKKKTFISFFGTNILTSRWTLFSLQLSLAWFSRVRYFHLLDFCLLDFRFATIIFYHANYFLSHVSYVLTISLEPFQLQNITFIYLNFAKQHRYFSSRNNIAISLNLNNFFQQTWTTFFFSKLEKLFSNSLFTKLE